MRYKYLIGIFLVVLFASCSSMKWRKYNEWQRTHQTIHGTHTAYDSIVGQFILGDKAEQRDYFFKGKFILRDTFFFYQETSLSKIGLY